MKIIITIIVIVGVGFFEFTSCKKYPEGPLINIEPKVVRLKGIWNFETCSINGVDQTDSFNTAFQQYQLIIDYRNSYKVQWFIYPGLDYEEIGTWEWIDKRESIHFKYKGNGHAGLYGFPPVPPVDPGEYDCRILRLKDKELWIKRVQDNGDVWELHFTLAKKTN